MFFALHILIYSSYIFFVTLQKRGFDTCQRSKFTSQGKRLSLRSSQVAHQAGAYTSFCSMKRLGVFLLPLDGMLLHHRVPPSSKYSGIHLYTWVKRCTVRVRCLAQEHNALPWPGLKPGPPDTESSALTIRPLPLPFTV